MSTSIVTKIVAYNFFEGAKVPRISMDKELFYNLQQTEWNRTNFIKIFFMSRSSKLFIGILSFLPIVLLIVMLFMVLRLFPTFIEWGNNYEPAPQEVFGLFGPIFILGF